MEAYLVVRYFSDWDEETENIIAVFTNKDAAEACLEQCQKINEKMIADDVKRANCVSYDIVVADLDPIEADIW